MKMARQWIRALKIFGQCANGNNWKHPENSRRSMTRWKIQNRRWRRTIRNINRSFIASHTNPNGTLRTDLWAEMKELKEKLNP